MPTYIVSVKRGLNEAQYAEAKKHLEDQGGRVSHAYERTGVAPGFTVNYPENSVSALKSGPHVEAVEEDQTVSTQ